MNNGYIPDVIEKGLYKTLYALILSLLDELFAHMKINIIGDQIHFRLQPGSPNPNSKFFFSHLQAQENLDLSAGGEGAGADPLTEYQRLLLEEKRCQQLLENIQKKKESLRLTQLQDDSGPTGNKESGGESSASLIGYYIFLVTVGLLISCVKK
jgi:hypothetical protein